MTLSLVDETFLESALSEAAAVEVPSEGVENILQLAGADSSDSTEEAATGRIGRGVEATVGRPAARYLRLHPRGAAVAAAAAAVLVVAVTVAGVLARPGRTGKPVASGATSASTLNQHLQQQLPALSTPSTTVPQATGSASGAPMAAPSLQQSDGIVQNGPNAPAQGSSPPVSQPSLPPGAVGSDQAIEKTGSVVLTVRHGSFERTMSELTALSTGAGGFVAQTQTDQSGASPSGTVTLEVPVGQFETVLDQVRTLGHVDSVSTQANDVTGQVVDLQSRLQALQESLSQYERILAQANSVGDILMVQSQIDSIQSQIEQLQGQENLLNAVTHFSTLAVSVSESEHAVPPVPGGRHGLARAWHDAVSGFSAAFDGLVSIAGPLLFALICLAAVLLLVRVGWKLSRRRLL